MYSIHRRCASGLLALACAAASSFADAADAPIAPPQPRTVADIAALLDAGPAASPRQGPAVLDAAPPDTTDRKQLARFYKAQAVAAEGAGAMMRYAQSMRKVVELGGTEFIEDDLMQLASAELAGNNFQAALAATRRALMEIPAGTNPGKRRALYQYVRRIYTKLGDLKRAEEAEQWAQAEFQSGLRQPYARQFIDSWTVTNNCSRAEYFLAIGKLDTALSTFQQCIDGMPAQIAEAARNRSRNAGATYNTDTFYRQKAFRARAGIADVLLEQGRLTEAEAAAREAITSSVKESGRDNTYTAVLVPPMTRVLMHQGRFAEARRLGRAGLDIGAAIGAAADATWVLELHGLIASAAVAEDRFEEGLAEFERGRAAMTDPAQAAFMSGAADWALALLMTGKAPEASALLQREIELRRPWLGETHVEVAELLGLQAMTLAARGDRRGALEGFRAATPVLVNAAITQGEEPSALRSIRLRRILEAFLDLLGAVHGTPLETEAGIDAAGEAFRIADALRNRTTQGAVAASAVRAAARDPALAGTMRKEQDLAQELGALFRILRELMAVPADQRLPQVIADMQARTQAIQRERSALAAGIAAGFPAYANLMRPLPPTIAEVRAALRADEALINIFSTAGATYVWAFRRDGPVAFATSRAGRDELAKRVKTLRKALDPGELGPTGRLPAFDLETAHGLYRELIAPVASGWQGAGHLLAVTNGSLSQLPLAVLPTAPATAAPDAELPYSGLREVPWLLRQVALTQLPSVNALMALRKLPRTSVARDAFVGFGDPQFALGAPPPGPTGPGLRALAVARPSANELRQARSVDWMDYSRIPPLPDTRDEILALARALKADPQRDVFLGARATRASVKALNLSGRRVVAFATHGLLAGDFPGVNEPSLALANPGGGQHGLLTLEDILGLKLDADWVVLSACNTASGDGQGAEALSGLARAFFYAGSRALLVTHWPVESVSARLLVTGVFERQEADPTLTRAEALRQSMLALQQQASAPGAQPQVAYAHPLFWAPYVVVGEGGR